MQLQRRAAVQKMVYLTIADRHRRKKTKLIKRNLTNTMTPYLGQIILLGFDFNPKTWQLCAGQLLPIQQNAALFAILGTAHGGDGVRTFGLPDLRGRIPIHWGQGPGLPPYILGELGGTESTTILANNLPLHNHSMQVYNGAGGIGTPANNVLAQGPLIGGANVTLYATTTNAAMSATALSSVGGNQPVSTLQPYLVLNYSIALSGIFPSRN
jgi:microcystin-dependent protein